MISVLAWHTEEEALRLREEARAKERACVLAAQERRAALVALYESGYTMKEVGHFAGISGQRVRQLLSQEGVGGQLRDGIDPIRFMLLLRKPSTASWTPLQRWAGGEAQTFAWRLGLYDLITRLFRARQKRVRRRVAAQMRAGKVQGAQPYAPRHLRKSTLSHAAIFQLRAEGLSYERIGKLAGVTGTAIASVCKLAAKARALPERDAMA